MIVPQYWAEGRLQHRKAGKQITVRRFGWSDTSQADAQTHADQRTTDALQRLVSGEKLERRELKIPYNGADGIPIREEILDRRGDTIITRNSYGASCLNTPNVFFADIDYDLLEKRTRRFGKSCFLVWLQLLFIGLAIGTAIAKGPQSLILSFLSAGIFLYVVFEWFANMAHRRNLAKQGGVEQIALGRVRDFVAANPSWNLRVYQTPAGLRLLASHSLFDPADPAVGQAFGRLGTDPTYHRMCQRQKCFRARVSPKPWRIGVGDHMRPRPGTWPVNPERLPLRNAWLARYQTAAAGFAACRLTESIGSGVIHPDVLPVMEWHDALSGATGTLPIA